MTEVYGPETAKSLERRITSGFFGKYCTGKGVDIGFRGEIANASPLPGAIGVELDYPGYDGKQLPFENGSLDYVYSSHCLEHISDWMHTLRDYLRVLRIGGHLIIAVPHKWLYEKKERLPSRYNEDHKRFYTPATLLTEIEITLPANHYRVRHLQDCDDGFDYSIPPDKHSCGCYEIECVIQKIEVPSWKIE